MGFVDDQMIDLVGHEALRLWAAQHQANRVVDLVLEEPNLPALPLVLEQMESLGIALSLSPVVPSFEHAFRWLYVGLHQLDEADKGLDQILLGCSVPSFSLFKYGRERIFSQTRSRVVLLNNLRIGQKPLIDKSLDDLVAHGVEGADFRGRPAHSLLKSARERYASVAIEHDHCDALGRMVAKEVADTTDQSSSLARARYGGDDGMSARMFDNAELLCGVDGLGHEDVARSVRG